MAENYDNLKEEYLSKSDEFTELNKEYNRAVRNGQLTDELELRFLKAERSLRESYRVMQSAKISSVSGKDKTKNEKDKK